MHGAVKRSGNAANGVVGCGGGGVEGQAETFDACIFQTLEDIQCKRGRGCGSNGDADTAAPGFGDEKKEVRTVERVTSGEDEVWKWIAEAGDLVEKG